MPLRRLGALLLVILLVLVVVPKRNQLPFCRSFELGVHRGSWIYDSRRTQKEWICCGWDDRRSLLPELSGRCAIEHPKGALYSGNNTHFATSGGHACDCDFRGGTLRKISEREKWVWKPNSCRLHDLDPRDFCRRLRSRKFLILGDSFAGQFATTMMNSLMPGGCAPLIVTAISDRLVSSKNRTVGRGKEWLAWVRDEKPDIVMLSLGAHVQDATEYNGLLAQISEEIKVLRAKTTIHFVWRTLHSAHANCTSFHAPLAKVPPAGPLYNWARFDQYDALATNVMRVLAVPVIDMSPTKLRPDAHPGFFNASRSLDCAHFCLPGPLDLGVQILYHRLVEDGIF